MAKSYLTPEELQLGNKWLKHVFFPCVKQGNADYVVNSWSKLDVVKACKEIYQFIVDRKLDTQDNLSDTFKTLGDVDYYNTAAFD